MNLTVQDNEILKTIEPQQLRDYRQAHGWYEDHPFLDNATIWLKQDADSSYRPTHLGCCSPSQRSSSQFSSALLSKVGSLAGFWGGMGCACSIL